MRNFTNSRDDNKNRKIYCKKRILQLMEDGGHDYAGVGSMVSDIV